MNQLVSIIVPCYNQAQYLDEALQSVFEQTYENWECIIVNDGSTDNSEVVAKEWTLRDSRFYYFHKENAGVSSARNFGIEKAKGDYLQFLDADDVIDKRKLELSLQELNRIANKEIKMVVSNFRMFEKKTEDSTPPFCNLNPDLLNFKGLLYEWNQTFSIPMHCGFFDSSLFKNIRFPGHMTAQEDWVVWVSLFQTGEKALFIDKPLAFYRKNPLSRMNTTGIDDNQIKAYEYFSLMLTAEQFNDFSIHLIKKYYTSDKEYKSKLDNIKKSNTYQTGLMIKKVLKAFGLLKISKYFVPLILKLKK